MKTLLLTLTYAVGIGELILGVYFWVTHSKSEIRRVMALLAFSTGTWVILSAVTSYVPYTAIGRYEMASVYILGSLLLTALLHLTLIFPFPIMRLDKLHILLLYLPLAIFSYILLTTNLIVNSFIGNTNWAGTVIGGPLFDLYNIYSILLFIVSIGVLTNRLGKLDGIHKKNIQIFAWSVILGGLPGVIFYLLLPTFYPQIVVNSLIGALSSAIWVGGTTYIVLRK